MFYTERQDVKKEVKFLEETMDQRQIKRLLEEAAKPDCQSQRLNEIQCALGAATAAMGKDGVYKIEGREAGIHLVLNDLFVSTLEYEPELLPSLFPVFALLCGDRDSSLLADINWTLV